MKQLEDGFALDERGRDRTRIVPFRDHKLKENSHCIELISNNSSKLIYFKLYKMQIEDN